MYPVSNAFLTAVKDKTRKYYWTGRITTTAGTVYEFAYRRLHKGCREEVLWHFITERFWASNGSVKSVEDGMTGEFIICFKGSERTLKYYKKIQLKDGRECILRNAEGLDRIL